MKKLFLSSLILLPLFSCSNSQEEKAFYDVIHGETYKTWYCNFDGTDEDFRRGQFITFFSEKRWDGGPVECSSG